MRKRKTREKKNQRKRKKMRDNGKYEFLSLYGIWNSLKKQGSYPGVATGLL